MSGPITTDNSTALMAEERLLKIRGHLTSSQIFDQRELQELVERGMSVWESVLAFLLQAASGTSTQRALLHGQIRREIAKLERDVEAAVQKYRRQVHRGQWKLMRALNEQIENRAGSSALKEACRQVLQEPLGFDKDLTALDIKINTKKTAKSCQALLKLMDAIARNPPRRRSSSMNMQTPLIDHSLAKAERREVLVAVSGNNHEGSHDAHVTSRAAARYGWC